MEVYTYKRAKNKPDHIEVRSYDMEGCKKLRLVTIPMREVAISLDGAYIVPRHRQKELERKIFAAG